MAHSRWWHLGQVFRPTVEGAPTTDPDHEENEVAEDRRFSALLALIISGVLAVGVLAAAVWLLLELVEKDETGPEAALSLVFVATAVVLILVVCTLTIVFKRLWLSNRNEAMGLPPGSVRSIIALLLIMLFFISAIFLFNSTKNEPVESRTLANLSLEQFQQIPADQILSSTTHVRGGEAVYDVTLLPDSGNTTTSDDIAKQLITTVATLVTAVAAFYFGANSVASAHKAAGRERRERRRLRRWRGPGGPRGPRGPGPRGGGPRGGGPRQAGAKKAAAKRTAAKRTAATKAAVTKAAATKKATSRQATPARKAAPRVAVRTPAKKGAAGTTR
jgi:hypothetical protein